MSLQCSLCSRIELEVVVDKEFLFILGKLCFSLFLPRDSTNTVSPDNMNIWSCSALFNDVFAELRACCILAFLQHCSFCFLMCYRSFWNTLSGYLKLFSCVYVFFPLVLQFARLGTSAVTRPPVAEARCLSFFCLKAEMVSEGWNAASISEAEKLNSVQQHSGRTLIFFCVCGCEQSFVSQCVKGSTFNLHLHFYLSIQCSRPRSHTGEIWPFNSNIKLNDLCWLDMSLSWLEFAWFSGWLETCLWDLTKHLLILTCWFWQGTVDWRWSWIRFCWPKWSWLGVRRVIC